MRYVDYRKKILLEKGLGTAPVDIARRIYLSYPTFSLLNDPDLEFHIKNAIAVEFKVDIFSVHFGGSGKTGESYHKKNVFRPGESDLDAAIISGDLFLQCLDEINSITNNFTDLTKFGSRTDDPQWMKNYIRKGCINPERMPDSSFRTRWIDFFNRLSLESKGSFSNVNCWIYSSQSVYELKFAKTISLVGGGHD